MTPVASIDAYHAGFPAEVQERLQLVRELIRREAPAATECINYGIPTFRFHGNLVHYGAYEKHLGFYPGASGMAAFSEQLSAFKQGKGSVQFPHDQPVPLELVAEIVRYRLKENEEMALAKKTKKKK